MTVEVNDLVKLFGPVKAIDHVSFTVKGEVLALLGPSGCGKTTTLRCVAGLESPTSGEIRIDGELVSNGHGQLVPPEKRGVGMVFQSYALWPHMKVFDNVAYPLKVRKYHSAEIKERVTDALELVGLAGLEKRYPAQLSGGQQQRVAVARAVCYEPKVILLDEPLSNLDAKFRERTRGELRRMLKRIGISSIYVTHDQEEAFIVADRVAVMHDGKIVQMDSPEGVYQNPSDNFVAGFVGQTNLIKGRVVAAPESGESGAVEVEDLGRLQCTVPRESSVGDDCLVIIHSNEIGMYDHRPAGPNVVECTVSSREYKGPVTDHRVAIGNTEITVTSHRFCELVNTSGDSRNAFLKFEPEAIKVIPRNQKPATPMEAAKS